MNIAYDDNRDHIMGERRPHSYCRRPYPRGGTSPASWRRAATTMEMNPGALPRPGRVPERLLQAASILKRRRWNREGFVKKGSCLGVSDPRGKYRRREESGGHPGQPGGLLAALGGAPGTLLGPWWWPSCSLLTFPEGSVTLIFNIIFPEFFGHFK